MAGKKSFLIKSNKPASPKLSNKWEPLDTATLFIDNIDTSDGNENASAEKFNLLVSGVPSPWARVKLTSYALSKLIETNDHRTLMLCYRYMKEEWRGLMAAYALKPDRFLLTEPISLKSTPMNERDPQRAFDITSTYAEMLFDEAPLWKYRFGKNESPYIQLLYYKTDSEQILVGATSPFTMFFTSANYSLTQSRDEIPWIMENGKFSDPASKENRLNISEKELIKLYSFLCNIDKNRSPYCKKLTEVTGETKENEIKAIDDCLMTELSNWRKEIKIALQELRAARGDSNTEVTEVPVIIKNSIKPKGPLFQLVSTEYPYYWKSGAFYTVPQGEDMKIERVSDLFIEGDSLVGWHSVNPNQNYSKAPVYYLEAKEVSNGELYYFALPFSKFALSFLDKALDQVINGETDKVKLTAIKNGRKLLVILSASINSEEVDILSKEFNVIEPETNGKIFVWPNFSSEYWNKYYYYSEYPTNDIGIRIIPEFKDYDFEPMLSDDSQRAILDNMFLVRYPVDKVSTNMHRYEVIETSTPLKSLSIRIRKDEKDILAGYLIVKTESKNGSNYMKNILTDPAQFAGTSVGIDFGSTNSCAYYKVNGDSDAKPMAFQNRRLALVGFDNPARAQATKDELFFVSNEPPINHNGQIKSWLHEHDIQYTGTARLDHEIVGGIPVNETNILVHSMTPTVIMTNAGKLNYNMKWFSNDEGVKKKSSFIRMIWIQICADLFDKEMKPELLRWSFPSAMGNRDISKLRKMYNELKQTPISGVTVKKREAFTEAEAVCSYALSKRVGLAVDRLFLGIDIGGSTSDILILGKATDPTKGIVNKLYSQCSVRMAASFFFNAINSSEKFRKSLYNFHESHSTQVSVLHIDDVINKDSKIYKRAPYYLNNVFDQLKGQTEFERFYSYLHKDVPFVFSLPAYITGILSFYAGMLVRSTIQKNKLNIKEVHFRYYGKGGRLFEWLSNIFEDETRSYLRKCTKAGLQMEGVKIVFDNLDDDAYANDGKLENKSEVAKGLVNLASEIEGVYSHNDDDDDDIKIRNTEQYEVLGEKGITYFKDGEYVTLGEQDILDDELFNNVNNFNFPTEFENFGKFIDLYTNFISDEIGCVEEVSRLRKAKNELSNLSSFFQNDTEKEGQISYRMPIFIASGLYYLENTLLPEIFKKENV